MEGSGLEVRRRWFDDAHRVTLRCAEHYSPTPPKPFWARNANDTMPWPLAGDSPTMIIGPMLHLLRSGIGPSVWTGRALQAESDDLEVIGLALLYPALERNVWVPGHNGYPRAFDLIRVSAPKAIRATNALERPFLHLLIPTRRPRRESQLLLLGSA